MNRDDHATHRWAGRLVFVSGCGECAAVVVGASLASLQLDGRGEN